MVLGQERFARLSGTRQQLGTRPLFTCLPKLELGVAGFFLSRRLHGGKSAETYDLYAIVTDKNSTSGRHKKVGEFKADVKLEEIHSFILLKKLAGEL